MIKYEMLNFTHSHSYRCSVSQVIYIIKYLVVNSILNSTHSHSYRCSVSQSVQYHICSYIMIQCKQITRNYFWQVSGTLQQHGLGKLPRASIKERCYGSVTRRPRSVHLAVERASSRGLTEDGMQILSLFILPLVSSCLYCLASGTVQHETPSSLSKCRPLPVQAGATTCQGCTNTIPQYICVFTWQRGF